MESKGFFVVAHLQSRKLNAMENPPFEDVLLIKNMVIFHCHTNFWECNNLDHELNNVFRQEWVALGWFAVLGIKWSSRKTHNSTPFSIKR